MGTTERERQGTTVHTVDPSTYVYFFPVRTLTSVFTYNYNQSSQELALNVSLILANTNNKTTIGTSSGCSYCCAQEMSLILR